MKGFLLFLVTVLSSDLVYAANIAVIDSAGDMAYLNSRSDRIIERHCFSQPDLYEEAPSSYGPDPSIALYFLYHHASGCPNGGVRATQIGDRRIKRATRGTGSLLYSTLSSNHLSDVADIALKTTSQNILALSAPLYHNSGDVPRLPSSLEAKVSPEGLVAALDYVLSNHKRLNIRVVNLSLGDGFFSGHNFCDNRITKPTQIEVRTKIKQLDDTGVVVVASAGNELPDGESAGQEFPACLSNVISVGGFFDHQGKRYHYGAVSDRVNFYDTADPLTSAGNTVTGTSFAAPKVAAVISELMSVNPSLSTDEIINAVASTSVSSGTIHYPGEPNRFDTGRSVVNLEGARALVADNFWKRIYRILEGVFNSTFIGWNAGSGGHENGAQFRFVTPTVFNNQFTQQVSEPATQQTEDQAAQTTTSVVRFSLKPYDIDTVNELEVLVNDKSYGYVSTTASNQFGANQTVCIAARDLKPAGVDNVVLLRLKNSRETWGVKDVVFQTGIQDSSCSLSTTAPVEPAEGQIDLLLGVQDTNRYGRNFGNDEHTDSLNIRFTPSQGLNHTFSWTAFDIGRNEMDLFFNNEKLKTVTATSFNGFGATESITLPASKINSGLNTLSFRTEGGNERWGVTNLLVNVIQATAENEPETTVILDEPSINGSGGGGSVRTDFNFDYSPRTPGYLNQVTISLDSFVKYADNNGFNMYLNGARVISVSPYMGQGVIRPLSTTLSASPLRVGSNTLTVEITIGTRGFFDGAWFRNLKVKSFSLPLFDLTVNDITVAERLSSEDRKLLTLVDNTGPRTSRSTSLMLYSSIHSDQSGAQQLGTFVIPQIVSGSASSVLMPITVSAAEQRHYYWACVIQEEGDIDSSNNCSQPKLLTQISLSPIMMLLLFD